MSAQFPRCPQFSPFLWHTDVHFFRRGLAGRLLHRAVLHEPWWYDLLIFHDVHGFRFVLCHTDIDTLRHGNADRVCTCVSSAVFLVSCTSVFFSLSLSPTHPLTHSPTLSLTLSLSRSLTLSLSHSLTLSLSRSLALSLSRSLALSLSRSLRSLALSLSRSLALSLSRSLALSLSHSLTLTHPLTHSPTLSLSHSDTRSAQHQSRVTRVRVRTVQPAHFQSCFVVVFHLLDSRPSSDCLSSVTSGQVRASPQWILRQTASSTR